MDDGGVKVTRIGVAQMDAGGKGGMGMETAKRISAERIEELERRVRVLEARVRNGMRNGETAETGAVNREEALVERYGECVDKTVASRLLGVTRATVYTMLADGRIDGSCEGRRVDVRSIARYLSRPSQRKKVS